MTDRIIYIGRETGCYTCKTLRPKVIAECERLKFTNLEFIDAESQQGEDLCEMYGIRSVPVLLFFDGKDIVGKETGSLADQEIKKYLKD